MHNILYHAFDVTNIIVYNKDAIKVQAISIYIHVDWIGVMIRCNKANGMYVENGK